MPDKRNGLSGGRTRDVLYDLRRLRVRAHVAQAQGEDAIYRDYRDRYRNIATELRFEGYPAWAKAMDLGHRRTLLVPRSHLLDLRSQRQQGRLVARFAHQLD
jgi:hypothetical protein